MFYLFTNFFLQRQFICIQSTVFVSEFSNPEAAVKFFILPKDKYVLCYVVNMAFMLGPLMITLKVYCMYLLTLVRKAYLINGYLEV